MSFLGLPTEVRHTIYAYAGLVRPCPIDMLREKVLRMSRDPREHCTAINLARGIISSSPSGLNCHCPDLSTNILYVSQQIRCEALEVLYGRNDFMILGRKPEDLDLIRNLPPLALKQVRSLLIRLNCWPCPNGHDWYCVSKITRLCLSCRLAVDQSDAVLSFSSLQSRQMFETWSFAAAHLAQTIQPGQVHLSFLADVASEDEALRIASDLRQLPPLKELDLRLSRNIRPSLRAIASETADHMTRRYRSAGVFPFDRLPHELQWRILELTQLSPSRDQAGIRHSREIRKRRQRRRGRSGSSIQRSDGQEYFRARDPARRNKEYLEQHAKRDESIYIIDNKYALEGRSGRRSTPCCRNCTRTAFSCCCPTLYAASSAFCLCRLVPFSLFYTSKAVSEMSTRIFYSQNNFVFHQSYEITSSFLGHLPSSLAGLIRQFTIKPRYFDPNESCQVADIATAFASQYEWELAKLFRVITERMDLSRLTFTFDTKALDPSVVLDDPEGDSYAQHCLATKYMHVLLAGAHQLRFRCWNSEWKEELINQLAGCQPTNLRTLTRKAHEKRLVDGQARLGP